MSYFQQANPWSLAASYGQGLGDILSKIMLELPRQRAEQQITLARLPGELQAQQGQNALNQARLAESQQNYSQQQQLFPMQLQQMQQEGPAKMAEMNARTGYLNAQAAAEPKFADAAMTGANDRSMTAQAALQRAQALGESQHSANFARILNSLLHANSSQMSTHQTPLADIIQQAQHLVPGIMQQQGSMPFLPQGTNSAPVMPQQPMTNSIPTMKPLDPQTASMFLQQAGGNKDVARQLARQAGYNF